MTNWMQRTEKPGDLRRGSRKKEKKREDVPNIPKFNCRGFGTQIEEKRV